MLLAGLRRRLQSSLNSTESPSPNSSYSILCCCCIGSPAPNNYGVSPARPMSCSERRLRASYLVQLFEFPGPSPPDCRLDREAAGSSARLASGCLLPLAGQTEGVRKDKLPTSRQLHELIFFNPSSQFLMALLL